MNPKHDAPEGGAGNRVDLGPAKYDLGRKLNAIVSVAKTWEDAAEYAAALFAPIPSAPSGLVDAGWAYLAVMDDVPGPEQADYLQRCSDYGRRLKQARVAFEAALSGQQGGAVPAGVSDEDVSRAFEVYGKATGLGPHVNGFLRAKCLAGLRDVLEDRARLAEQPAPAERSKDWWLARARREEGCESVQAGDPAEQPAPADPIAEMVRLSQELGEDQPAPAGTGAETATLYARRLTISYTNWRGEFGRREIAPIHLIWGSNEWHPEPQWLIEAWDISKAEIRTFALIGIGGTGADGVEGLRKAAQDVLDIWDNQSDVPWMVNVDKRMEALRAALDGASGQEGR